MKKILRVSTKKIYITLDDFNDKYSKNKKKKGYIETIKKN